MIVGSVNTILYYLYKENNIEIPNYVAGLMISGIISDTVLLNSPTTTLQDKYVLNELSNQINIDYNDYGMKLLKSGMSIEGYKTEDIIYRDYKTYTIDDKTFSVGQVLTVDYNDFINDIPKYVDSLNKISLKNGYTISTLYITNILTKNSMIIFNENGKHIIEDAYNIKDAKEGIIIDGILSRKKQIVPFIMEALKRD